MISLKQKYLWMQGFSAFVSIGAIALLFYFCSHGFTKLVGISAKNLDALYNTGELKSMLWKERADLRIFLEGRAGSATFEKSAEKVSALASAMESRAAGEFRDGIVEFVRIHGEMRAYVRTKDRGVSAGEREAFRAKTQEYYDREHAALESMGDYLLLHSHEQQSEIIRTASREMRVALAAGVGFAGLALLLIFLYLRKAVIDPIMAISKASLDAAGGEYHPIPEIRADDEIGVLARNFNHMISRIRQASDDLTEFNRSLEAKVEERTEQLLEAEGKLVTAAKMSALGEMAGGVAHEINTPLATIGLLSEQIADLAAEETIDRAMIAKMTGTIGLTVRRISSIIKGLRTFSRDGSQDPFVPAGLRQIVEETLLLCGEKLKNGNVHVEIDPIADDVRVHCRPVQISQVLLNLVSNACDAIRELPEKRIRIGAEIRGDRVRVSVTDSGSGIPEAIRTKLFQPFFTTKEIGKGTGLGLSISRGILVAHGGTLDIDTACPNTRFLIDLPSKAGAVPESEAA